MISTLFFPVYLVLLTSIQVVLANGSIVEANANTNESLFRALKGGTSNYGEWDFFNINGHDKINY